jgi:hypothetical protein
MSLHRYLVMWSAVVGCLAGFLGTSLLCCAEGKTTTASPSAAKRSPIVKSPAGNIEGLIEGRLHVFKGIPYVCLGGKASEARLNSGPHAGNPNRNSRTSTLAIRCR